MSQKILEQIKEINPQSDQFRNSSQERNEIEETNQQSNQSRKKLSLQTIIIMGISIGIIIIAIIVIIVVVATKKDDKKKDNNSSENYYISDEICDSNNICYRLVNPNIEHYIFTLSEKVDRMHVRYKNRYGIE